MPPATAKMMIVLFFFFAICVFVQSAASEG
jgi:hypothetical protein